MRPLTIWHTPANVVFLGSSRKDEQNETPHREMAWETAPLPSHNTDHPHSSTQPGSQGARDKITPGGSEDGCA